MNQKVADGIRASVLTICDEGEPKSMSNIVGDERLDKFIERYGKEEIARIVYALVGSGALFVGGKGKSSVYATTEIGREFRLIYEASFEEVREEWDELTD